MAILSDTSELSDESHKRIEVVCDFQLSKKCRKKWTAQYRDIRKTLQRNNNQVICLYCSHTYKYSGRRNPNCKYKTFDDSFFKEINTDFKAYLLGWIASDGSLNKSGEVPISLAEKDKEILIKLRDNLCAELPIKVRDGFAYLTFSSTEAMKDICSLLNILPGKKAGNTNNHINFPQLANDELRWAFIRGFFDGDGSVSDPIKNKKRFPVCTITSSSTKFLKKIKDFVNIPGSLSKDKLEWSGTNALDFLGKIYEEAPFALRRKLFLYHTWCCWEPSLKGSATHGKTFHFKWNKSRKDAVPPFKTRVSDSGYDLTLVGIKKIIGNIIFYTTGIKITPPFGYYFDLVPRSSITKTGYTLAHNIGILDRSYTGEILVPLVKIDPEAPDLLLPARIIQIIPREVVHFGMIEVDELSDTSRGEGGFGSSGK